MQKDEKEEAYQRCVTLSSVTLFKCLFKVSALDLASGIASIGMSIEGVLILALAVMSISRSLGIPRVTFISPRPAKWKVLRVIWVDGSPTDWIYTENVYDILQQYHNPNFICGWFKKIFFLKIQQLTKIGHTAENDMIGSEIWTKAVSSLLSFSCNFVIWGTHRVSPHRPILGQLSQFLF